MCMAVKEREKYSWASLTRCSPVCKKKNGWAQSPGAVQAQILCKWELIAKSSPENICSFLSVSIGKELEISSRGMISYKSFFLKSFFLLY